MAFCTSCGTTLDPNSQFCVKCGARQAAGVGGGAAVSPAPSPAGGSNAVKIVLIIVAGLCVLGVVGTIASVLIVRKVAKDTKVMVDDGKGTARVVTPFGTLESTTDATKIAQNLGVEIYPGAHAVKGGSEVQAMGMHTVTGIFETNDPVEKVVEFYRGQYPKGVYSASDHDHTLVSGDKGLMVTIHMQDEGSGTKITIVNVAGKGVRPPNVPDVPEPPSQRTN